MENEKKSKKPEDEPKNASPKKKAYLSPELQRHGSLAEITLGGLAGMNDPSGPSTGKG